MPSRYVIGRRYKRRRIMPHRPRIGYYIRTGRHRRCPTYRVVTVRRVTDKYGRRRRVAVRRRGGGTCYGWRKWTLRKRYA